jgi:DNA topoisomerase-2
VLLNRKLVSALFPAADYHILEFKFDEGSRSEPKHFVPVIPLAICESTELPAHGWKLELWARDVYSVIDNVRRLINYGPNTPLLDMPPCTYKGNKFAWKGEFRTIRGKYCSVGKYYIESDTIVIYELPLRVWTNNYVSDLKKKAASHPNLIEKIDQGMSNDTAVDIRIKLLPGAINTIESYGDSYYTDGVEEFFNLTNSMKSHINLMDTTGGVMECSNYGDVFRRWFPVRRDLYGARIDRMVVLIELKIKRMENIIRYIKEYKTLKIPNKKKTEMIDILTTNKFDKMNNTLLKSPGFTPTSELHMVMNSADSKYDYLLLLNDFDKSQEGLQDYIAKLAKLQTELNDLHTMANQGMFRGAVLFEQELNALEKIIKEGFRTNWKFENAGKHKFS